MIVGLVFTLFYIISVKFTGMPAWFFGVSTERIGTLGMFLNLIVTFIVSRLTAPLPVEIQEMVELRTPTGELAPTLKRLIGSNPGFILMHQKKKLSFQ